jgi:hypothetical protein
LGAFLEGDVHRAAHPGEELQQRPFLGRQHGALDGLATGSRTVADVVAWYTSNPTYFVELLMRAASCRGERSVRNR